ncbi:hypothetical protein H6504_00710 [Candidatus Woesearchaeota archaeon]|nr:hypothetical protein [Candidatus Woesearchaeota archaeon]
MHILHYLFDHPHIRMFYHEQKDLRELRRSFEMYVFSVYDKVRIITEIQNKVFDIRNENGGFIDDDKKNFALRAQPLGNVNYEKDRKPMYYKGWVNRRLKQIKKILHLELRSKHSVQHMVSIIDAVNGIENRLSKVRNKHAAEELEELRERLHRLVSNLEHQQAFIDELYPLKNWSLNAQDTLFTKSFSDSVFEEIRLLFNMQLTTRNYNCYQAEIAKAIHQHDIPHDSFLGKLIEEHIAKVNGRKISNLGSMVTCYHARPIYIRGPLFPLDARKKSTGFFVDTSAAETRMVVEKIYGITNPSEVEVFKLQIPRNVFRYALRDNNDSNEVSLMGPSLEHSKVFRPTFFPNLNEFYTKGLIIVQRL